MKYSKKQVAEATERLRELLPVGGVCYTNVKSVAKSGLSRKMELFVVENGSIIDITWLVATVLGDSVQSDGTIRVHGCGMDMGFDVVYRLSRRLFPDGFKPRDAGKEYGRNGTSADEVDNDGGYALKQRWL